ncbi:hypothetical protein LJR143_000849 [Pseudoxanthomonas sp. LjRoot143]|uniref:hypothetical protein n=1 Tax=Pseudoxanthomonas sp. LjRoot143 TaxID=3342266 RepID=UPI003ECC48A6
MHDPYTPPHAIEPASQAAAGFTPRGMQWRRIILGSVALFLALAAWAFAAGFLIPTVGFRLSPDGGWIETAIIIRKAVYAVISTFAYWWFAKGVRYRRLIHVLLAWSLVQLIDTAVVMAVMSVLPLSPVRFAWSSILLNLLPAIAGWALTWVWPGRHPRAAQGEG